MIWDEVITIGITGIAALLNLACHNDHQIKESPIKTAGRRLMITAQLLAITWVIWLTVELGDSLMSRTSFFIFLLWGLGSIMSSLDHIGRRWGREISELLKPKVYYERRKHPRGRL